MGANILSQYFHNIYDTIKTMLSGMSLTMHHLRNKKDLVATLQYPNEKWPQPDRSIGFDHSEYNVIRSRLHVDIDDCIGCLQCEKACPVDCIKIDTIKPGKDSDFDCGSTSHDTKKKMIVPRFTIDMSECMYCNLCVYPCPEECIYMVGGPNEPKHEIDYEYSKYVKHDLLFEFSNVTDQEIVDIGGQSYLDNRKAISEKKAKGEKLEGMKIDDLSEVVPSETPDMSKPSKGIDEAFILFKSVPDKKLKSIARKTIAYSRRKGENVNTIAEVIIKLVGNAMTTEMEKALSEFRSFKYSTDTKVSENIKDEVSLSKTSDSPVQLFDIKKLNVIEDKLIRGSFKKIYMAGKRNNTPANQVIDEMLILLKNHGSNDSDIISLLNSLRVAEVVSESKDELSSTDVLEKEVPVELFDIKELNAIDDKMIRGSSKKIFMSGKRGGKTSLEIVEEIKSSIVASGKMNEDIKQLLESIV